MMKLLLTTLAACVVAGAAAATPATEPAAAPVASAAPVAAEPIRLDDAQMDGVSAGFLGGLNIAIVTPLNINVSPAIATAIGVFGDATAIAITETLQQNVVEIRQRNRRRN